MRILWLCSTMTPRIAEVLGVKSATNVSWIVNALEQLKKDNTNKLAISFPMKTDGSVISGSVDGMNYYAFNKPSNKMLNYDEENDNQLSYIINDFQPEVIHIWGTEYPHTLSMLNACKTNGLLDNVVVSIQGLCSFIAKHYYAGLPEKIIKRYTLRDLLKRENIKTQKEIFEKRGEYEVKSLSLARNVIGRTDWDRACTKQINPNLNYYFCNETLRKSFYDNIWDYEKCKKHSIFISQGYYPVKGLHMAIEALSIVKKKFSDATMYVGGLDLINRGKKTSSYGKYIKQLLKKYKLEDSVIFTGMLDEENMCQQYLNANVFLSASSIENSPNSVGEAMLLGMPVVSSDVGGVKNLLIHNEEGYIYPFAEPYMAAHYINKVFSDGENAIALGLKAKNHAQITHNEQNNTDDLLGIYKIICNN